LNRVVKSIRISTSARSGDAKGDRVVAYRRIIECWSRGSRAGRCGARSQPGPGDDRIYRIHGCDGTECISSRLSGATLTRKISDRIGKGGDGNVFRFNDRIGTAGGTGSDEGDIEGAGSSISMCGVLNEGWRRAVSENPLPGGSARCGLVLKTGSERCLAVPGPGSREICGRYVHDLNGPGHGIGAGCKSGYEFNCIDGGNRIGLGSMVEFVPSPKSQ